MKNKHYIAIFIIMFLCSGCAGVIWRDVSQIRTLTHNQAVLNNSYADMMQNGETSPDQDLRAVQSNAKAWSKLDKIINENQKLY